MRIASGIVVFYLAATQLLAQEGFSDAEQYDAYQKGDWETVIEEGKLAKKAGVDYYYIRARNGYAYMMKGNYRRAEKELDKALKFNGSDAFAKRYAYWSAVYSGKERGGLVRAAKFTEEQKKAWEVRAPKLLRQINLLGGYRISSSSNIIGNMPYIQGGFGSELGNRLTLDHSVSYLNYVWRGSSVWQVGYMAGLGIQVGKNTTAKVGFLMQHWESGLFSVYDLGFTGAVRQSIGLVDLTLFGGYMEQTSDVIGQAGLSATIYPFGNQKLFTSTTFSGTIAPTSRYGVLKQSITGKLVKDLWLSGTFVFNNEVIPFEDINFNFSNTNSDVLNWRATVTPVYYIKKKYGISLSYSAESRTEAVSQQNYNYHSFYLGFNVKL